ncbi:prostatic acid phosphatase-like isoform X2 [Brevipalpus obovatus]|uniref:prostatic acid phosphatase-like isoform X2 n=1 Tax=Brevipalpus obovatus TaxID=246614 RepID=UPI003D9DC511
MRSLIFGEDFFWLRIFHANLCKPCIGLAFIIHLSSSTSSSESTTTSSPDNDDNLQLELVILIFRHGERTPYRFYDPNDPYNDPKFWPDGDSQLLATGKRRMFDLGKSFRKRYKNFLTESPREVYARSSNQDRCLESAQLVLHGMYKAEGRWMYHDDTDFLPIPVHTVSSEEDSMLTVDANCPVAKAEKARLISGEQSQNLLQKYSRSLNLIEKHIGERMTDINLISDFYVTIMIEREEGYELAPWMDDQFLSDLRAISDMSYYITQSSPKILSFRITNLFQELQKQINAKISTKPPLPELEKKLLVYSTHDNIISALLIALGVFDNRQPAYGASVILEVWKNSAEERFVSVQHWNDTELPNPIEKIQPYCDQALQCPLDNFFTHMNSLILDDWHKECGLKECESVWSDPYFIALIVLIFLILSIMLVGWLRLRCLINHSRRNGYERLPS